MDCVTSGNEQKQTVCQDIAFCESASQRGGYEARFFAGGSALRELCSILGRARFGFDIVSPREGREAYGTFRWASASRTSPSPRYHRRPVCVPDCRQWRRIVSR